MGEILWQASKNKDWGFDEIWPSTKAVDQPWFKAWDERERRAAMSPFSRAFEDDVDATVRDMRKAIGRQVYIPINKVSGD